MVLGVGGQQALALVHVGVRGHAAHRHGHGAAHRSVLPHPWVLQQSHRSWVTLTHSLAGRLAGGLAG